MGIDSKNDSRWTHLRWGWLIWFDFLSGVTQWSCWVLYTIYVLKCLTGALVHALVPSGSRPWWFYCIFWSIPLTSIEINVEATGYTLRLCVSTLSYKTDLKEKYIFKVLLVLWSISWGGLADSHSVKDFLPSYTLVSPISKGMLVRYSAGQISGVYKLRAEQRDLAASWGKARAPQPVSFSTSAPLHRSSYKRVRFA